MAWSNYSNGTVCSISSGWKLSVVYQKNLIRETFMENTGEWDLKSFLPLNNLNGTVLVYFRTPVFGQYCLEIV